MTTTIDRHEFGSALDRYADGLIREIRADYHRYGLDMTFIPRVLDDDFASLVPAELTTSTNAYDFVLGYVSARVASAFASSN